MCVYETCVFTSVYEIHNIVCSINKSHENYIYSLIKFKNENDFKFIYNLNFEPLFLNFINE